MRPAGDYCYPGKGLDGLRKAMESCLARGYSVVKMKIGGAVPAPQQSQE